MAGGMTAAASRGHLRAAHADREQVIDTLKAAFVQGRLAKEDFDLRIGRTLAARTYADLAAIAADIPAGPAAVNAGPTPAQPLHEPVRALTWAEKTAAWGLYGIVMTVMFTIAVVPGQTTIGAAAVTAAVIYSALWLLGGVVMVASRHGGAHPHAGQLKPGAGR
jgi:hypothetical protein